MCLKEREKKVCTCCVSHPRLIPLDLIGTDMRLGYTRPVVTASEAVALPVGGKESPNGPALFVK